MAHLILASSSPRRKELLQNLHISYDVVLPDVDENIDKNLPPSLYVKELALLKGSAVLKKCRDMRDVIIVAADTVVVCDGEILGKPCDRQEARQMISHLSGRSHQVMSGVCVLNHQTAVSRCAVTNVSFRPLSDAEIEEYIATDEPYDKAGGYGVQGLAKSFVDGLAGDYYNVVGLPMAMLCRMLKEDFLFDTVKEAKLP